MISWTTNLSILRGDAIYGLRRLAQTKITSAAAILSLALAIGACTSAFRLMDALLFRPLPVAHPERLFTIAYRSPNGPDGRTSTYDSNSYPAFQQMKAAVKDRARLIAVSYADRTDLTYGSSDDMEKAGTQFVAGDMFATLGLKPALGRLLDENDDLKPGAHPVAVISHDYWRSRFAGDPGVIGRSFRIGDNLYGIVGVAPAGFNGTETGTSIDIFMPMMMKNPATLASWNNFWLRILIMLEPGASPAALQEQLAATHRAIELERLKSVTLTPMQKKVMFTEALVVEPAGAGRSNLQRDYRDSLYALAIMVMLVLLIASANLANLMTARAIARSREIAVRVSLGASRARLLQLLLMESVWIAALASLAGMLLSSWATPFIVRLINSPDDPVQLTLALDFRLLVFSIGLSLLVTFLFGLPSALRASSVQPSPAFKGSGDSHRGRVMDALILVQVSFCVIVLLVTGLFVRSFDRLSREPLGYSPERIVNLETIARRPQPAVYWEQIADRLRSAQGVESVALAAWPLMSGETANSAISSHGVASEVFADRFMVSPGWFEAMKIPILSGRDFRRGEARPGPAVVNQTFVKQFFADEDPLGKPFEILDGHGGSTHVQIAGVVPDSRYRDNLRIPIRPMFYVPFRAVTPNGDQQPLGRGTFVIRTSPGTNPVAVAAGLRREVSLARSEFYVSNVRTQRVIVESKTIRERLLAILAVFFAAVAILLAAVGLYGVLDYSVLQRRREIGIRIAIGATNRDIIREVTFVTFAIIVLGAALGLAAGIGSIRYIESVLYRVSASDPATLLPPVLLMIGAAILAAVPAVLRALRTDPAVMLRAE